MRRLEIDLSNDKNMLIYKIYLLLSIILPRAINLHVNFLRICVIYFSSIEIIAKSRLNQWHFCNDFEIVV